MKKIKLGLGLGLALLLVVVLIMSAVSCAKPATEPPDKDNTSDFPSAWYMPGHPAMLEPEVGENLEYWDWGTLLPNKDEELIAEGDGWAAYKRGNFKGYSILFPLDRADGLHPPTWSNRLVEVYPDHAIEIIPEGLPEPKGPVGRILNARKHGDTYVVTVVHTGVWHIDSNGKTLHQYLNEFNSHEAEILPNGHLLVCTPINDTAREVDWEGNVYWEWGRAEHILPYCEQNIPNLSKDSPFEDPLYLISTHHQRGSIVLNSVQALPNGHHLISLRDADLIVELDENNEAVWTFGSMILKHQHHATKLENGNVLIHNTCGMEVIEVSPKHKIVWQFDKGMVSTYQGMAQRLEDGNTVISDTYRTIAFCVNPQGEVLWEVYIKGKDTLTRTEALEYQDEVRPGFRIYRAWCYPIEE